MEENSPSFSSAVSFLEFLDFWFYLLLSTNEVIIKAYFNIDLNAEIVIRNITFNFIWVCMRGC